MYKHFASLVFIFLLTACAVNRVNTDFDPTIQFEGIGRYAWAPLAEGASKFPSLDQQRIRAAVDNALAQHAMRPVEREEAQLWVDGGIEFRDVQDVNTMEFGASTWNHPFWIGGDTVVRVDNYTQAHIYVQFISPKDSRVVWKGKVITRWSESMPPQKRVQLLTEAVNRILAAFPPKQLAAQ